MVDDFRGKFPLEFMLRLCQGHPFEAPTKGGHVFVTAMTVILISNLSQHQIYSEEPDELRNAFLSRLHPARNGLILECYHERREQIVEKINRALADLAPPPSPAPSTVQSVPLESMIHGVPTLEASESLSPPSSPPMP